MNFLYPNTLWFLLLLSIPILIHLFHFRRHKKIYFSSLQFMQSLQKEKKSIQKLQSLLILLFRLMALAFLVLAFAQPFVSDLKNLNRSNESIVSIYIDNSYSMSAKGLNGELLSEAKQAAKALILASPKNQRYTISSNELNAVQKRILNAKDAQIEIDKLEYTPIQRTFDNLYNWHQELQVEATENRKPIHFDFLFLSDFQSEFFDITSIKKDSSSTSAIWQFSPQKSENCYVDSLWFNSKTHRFGDDSELTFRLNNNSQERLVNFEVNVSTNNGFDKDLFVDIPKNAFIDVSVTIPNKTNKVVNGKIELRDQSIFWDDVFFFSFQNTTESKVFIINGIDANSSVIKAFETERFFKITETAIQSVNQSDLYKQQLVVLNGIRNISSGLRADLLKFKARGGNIFVLPSMKANIPKLNPLLKSIGLPEIKTIRTVDLKADQLALKDPIYNGVFENQDESLNLPSFRRVFNSNFKQTTAIPLMFLRDQSPVFFRTLDHSFGLYSSLDDNSSDLILNSLFPVLCIRIAETAGNSTLPYYFVGQDEIIPFEKDRGNEKPVKLQNKSNDFIPKIIQEGSYNYIDISGIEAMENLRQGNYILNQQTSSKNLSLNYNRKESSILYKSLNEIKKELNTAGIKNIRTESINERTNFKTFKLNNNYEYWRICIFITILAVFCEILIAKFWKK
jgi:hypothetical protein